MKRKFINGLLLLALFVGFTGSVVSCKDYDDEKLGEMDGRVADLEKTLRQELADQKADLEALIKQLRTDLTNCQETCKAFRDATDAKFNLYVKLTELNTILGDYYKKNETYNQTEINNKLQEIRDLFANYYDKAYIDGLFAALPDFSTFATKAELTSAVSTLEGKINQVKTDIEAELLNYVKAAELEQTVADMLSNAEGKLYKALETYFTNNATISAFIDGKIDTKIAAYDATVQEAILKINNTIDGVKAEVTAAQKRADDAYELADQANKLAGTAKGIADEALQKAKNNAEEITKLQNSFTTLSGRVDILDANLQEVTTTANTAFAQAEANALLISHLQDAFTELDSRVEGIEGDVNTLKAAIDDTNESLSNLSDVVAANKAEAEALHAQILETISGLVEAITENAENIDTLNGTVGQLAEDIETVKGTIATEVEKLQNQINTANENIAANTTAIGELAGLLKNVAAKWITGIELNGSYNPMFGELNLPVDVRSNMLIAFHGTLGNDGIEFPTRDQVYYQQETEQWKKFTLKDVEMLGGINPIQLPANKTIINVNDEGTEEGNAGTLYLTVNPTDRDFTGTEFKLIDSNDNTSLVTLSDLKKSDHTLWFGYTRAGVADGQSGNGFYEAKATFTEEALQSNNRLRLDIQSLKDVIADLKDYENGFDLHNLTEAVYFNINKFLIANAVKATWTDELGTKSVVSQYGIGATSIKPLSFAWGKDIEINHVPGLGMVEDFIDRLIDKACAGFPELRFIDYEVEDITMEDLDEDGNANEIVATFHIHLTTRHIVSIGPKTVEIDLPEWYAYDENGKRHTIHPNNAKVTVYMAGNGKDVDITLSYDISDELFHLGNYYTEPQENIRAQIEMYLDDIRDFLNDLADIKPSQIADNAKDGISDYFNEIFKRYKRYLNPNKYVQPTLLIKSDNGYRRLSRSAKVPAQIKGTSLLLAPTTYTAEIISPAYKKFVAVTNVCKGDASAQGGDAACKNVLDKANAQDRINEVINGGWGPYIEFEAEDGYTYEVLYSAVDYTGLVFTEKYYFTVSK